MFKMKIKLFFVVLLIWGFNVYAQLPKPDHIVIVIEENQSYKQVIDSSAAPYIYSLANGTYGANFTQSYAETHPSQPNYIWLFSGDNQGVTNDNLPSGLPFTTANLGAELLQNGYTFIGYSEDLPSVGFNGATSGKYARKHNPWANWQDSPTNGIPSSLNISFSDFPADFTKLPTISFVMPNLQNDMHDGTITQADTWLKNNLDNYIQWAKTHNSLFILTEDEDDGSSNNRIPTVIVGQAVKAGSYSENINHVNVLRTLEDMYGLSYAGSSDTAAAFIDCWMSLALAKPTLISPFNNATGVSLSPILVWTAVSGADKYRLEVNTKQDFTGGIVFDNAALTDTTQALSGLSYYTTYYWRVTASSNALSKVNTSDVYSFTTKLATTTLSSPTNNSTSVSLSPTLTWTAVSGADKYRLEVNSKADFSGTVIYDQDTVGSASKQIGGLFDNTTCYWRVTALNNAGNSSDASSTFSFTTSQAVLSAAANGAIGVSISPTLSWNKTTGASKYRLEVNTKNDFTGTVAFDNSAITDTTQAISGLSNNTTYYWRVTASSNALAKTTTSNVYSFTTKLATATLTTPTNNATGVSLSPTLVWSAVSGADKYRLEVNSKADFTGTVIYDQDTVSSASKQIGGLFDNTKYYWRVTALNNAGNTSDTSSSFNFTTSQAVLTASSNGATAVSTSPTLSWYKTTGASKYRLEVNTKSDFTENSSI